MGGEPAATFDITGSLEGKPWRHLNVLTIHNGKLFTIALSTEASRYGRDAARSSAP